MTPPLVVFGSTKFFEKVNLGFPSFIQDDCIKQLQKQFKDAENVLVSLNIIVLNHSSVKIFKDAIGI